jgi:hypothetical protein
VRALRYCPVVARLLTLHRGVALASSCALALVASIGRAEPTPPLEAPPGTRLELAPAPALPSETVPPGLRGPRIGFTPGIGVGFAGFTGNVAFPSFVFTTALQIEALLELERWGFFVRGGFLSAGSSGRWIAPTVALGSQYRFIGDGEERWGLVVRAGAIYERWNATPASGSCDIFYVIPNSCQNFVEPPTGPGASAPTVLPVTAESVGLLAAVRVDVPFEPLYLALDAELAAAADVDQSTPGAAITGQLVLTFALRDHPIRRKGPQQYGPRPRFPY